MPQIELCPYPLDSKTGYTHCCFTGGDIGQEAIALLQELPLVFEDPHYLVPVAEVTNFVERLQKIQDIEVSMNIDNKANFYFEPINDGQGMTMGQTRMQILDMSSRALLIESFQLGRGCISYYAYDMVNNNEDTVSVDLIGAREAFNRITSVYD
jgi:hypothetical protein